MAVPKEFSLARGPLAPAGAWGHRWAREHTGPGGTSVVCMAQDQNFPSSGWAHCQRPGLSCQLGTAFALPGCWWESAMPILLAIVLG